MPIMDEAVSPALQKSASLKKYFHDLYTGEDSQDGKKHQVLDVAPVTKQEIYLAIEEVDLASSHRRRVFGRLCLAVQGAEGEETAYRTEEEEQPPSLTNCPLRILYLLTPTTDVRSLEWRLQCYEQQIEEARTELDKTKARYAAMRIEAFRDAGRKSAEMMIERRFLILHQAMSAEQITRALRESLQ